jgi:diaminohydroxyphosphoribosylaminopyrimidine deaminase/5-amino-6-(5-phosphoribosylamino)uracil reductase
VLVGVGTVLADDPELTSRLQNARQPLRVVLDSNLRTPASARVLPALVATTAGGELPGAELLRLPSDSAGRVDARALLEELGRRDVLSVLVEGGAEIHAALLAAGLVDKVVAYIAPIVIGGRAAAGPVAGLGVDEVEDALRLRDVEITAIGDDVLLSGYVHRDSQRDRTGRGGG